MRFTALYLSIYYSCTFVYSSKAYRGKLEEHGAAAPRVVERSEAFMPDETHPADRSTTWGVVDFQQDGTDVEDTLRKPEAKHFRLREYSSCLLLPSMVR